jgi:hypothetical protein
MPYVTVQQAAPVVHHEPRHLKDAKDHQWESASADEAVSDEKRSWPQHVMLGEIACE